MRVVLWTTGCGRATQEDQNEKASNETRPDIPPLGRLAMGESTLRSQLDAEHVTEVVREEGAVQLAGASELTLILDGMELRRAGADAQEDLMQVIDLDGRLVNGYRSFNVLGMGADEERGLLYHRLFSSEEDGYRSENTEWRRALAETEACLEGFGGVKTWVLDRGSTTMMSGGGSGTRARVMSCGAPSIWGVSYCGARRKGDGRNATSKLPSSICN